MSFAPNKRTPAPHERVEVLMPFHFAFRPLPEPGEWASTDPRVVMLTYAEACELHSALDQVLAKMLRDRT